MESRTYREYFRRAYKAMAKMQKSMQKDGIKDSEILRKMANIIEILEDYPELGPQILQQLEAKWL